jgi:hypothetical protein
MLGHREHRRRLRLTRAEYVASLCPNSGGTFAAVLARACQSVTSGGRVWHTESQEVAAKCVVELTRACAHGEQSVAPRAVQRLTEIVATCGAWVDPTTTTFGATLVAAVPQIATAAAAAGASSSLASASYRLAWRCDRIVGS